MSGQDNTPSLPARREFDQERIVEAMRLTKAKYELGRVSGNPDGKPMAQWSAGDFYKLNDGDIFAIRAAFADERYDLIDGIKPTSMTRAEFERAVLREAAQKGIVDEFYQTRFQDAPNAVVSVTRPLDASGSPHQVSGTPVTLTLHDAAVGVLRNPRAAGIVFQPDVANAMGRPDLASVGVSIYNDAATYDLGYTAGAMAEFRRGQPLELGLGFAETMDKVQPAYCAVANEIFSREGRTLDQTEAFSAGFVQARMDARSNFQGQDIPIGLSGQCPRSNAPITSQDRVNLALVR